MDPFRLITVILLLLLVGHIKAVQLTDVRYEELEELNATCKDLDNCKKPRQYDEDSLVSHGCHCGRFCAYLFTCCIDSPYREIELKPTLAKPVCKIAFGHDKPRFIINKCPADIKADDIFKGKCEGEWSEKSDDLISLIPVASLFTRMVYKNYFCFRCNEEHDEYLYWNVRVRATDNENREINTNGTQLAYDNVNKTWLATLYKNGEFIPVTLKTEIPSDLLQDQNDCQLDVISSCSENWEDNIIRRKCEAYTSLITIPQNGTFITYKNPHCALCNFQQLTEMQCPTTKIIFTVRKFFSFSLLLDINRSDGDKVGKIEHCDEDSTWDPFFKKCRALKCALPGHIVIKGTCTAS